MYAIFTYKYWSVFPVTDVFKVAKWNSVEAPFEFQSSSLNEVIKKIKDEYADKVCKIPYKDRGSECFLCFIVKDGKDIIGGVDFDKNVVLFNDGGVTVCDYT